MAGFYKSKMLVHRTKCLIKCSLYSRKNDLLSITFPMFFGNELKSLAHACGKVPSFGTTNLNLDSVLVCSLAAGDMPACL